MKTKILNDFCADLAKGKIDGSKAVILKGSAAILVAGSTPGNISGLYAFPSTATVMQVSSSSASDVDQTIKVKGLDSNSKYQEEDVTLDGETPVETEKIFSRINSIEVVSGSALVGDVSLTNGTTTFAKISIGKTKSDGTFYSVPAGSELLVEKVSITTSDTQDIKITSTTDTYNIATNFIDDKVYPNIVTGDFRLDGYTTGQTSDEISVTVECREDRLYSVPVDITNFAATAGDEEIDVEWDALGGTSDLTFIYLGIKLASESDYTYIKLGLDETSYTFSGLINDVEYDVAIYTEGYDGLTSTPATDSATPTAFVFAPVTNYTVTAGECRLEFAWTNPVGSTGVIIEAFLGEWMDVTGILVNKTATSAVLGVASSYGAIPTRITATYVGGNSTAVTAEGVTALEFADVTNLTATPGDTEVVLDWDDIDDGYTDSFDIIIDDSEEPINISNDPVTSTYTATGLTNGVEYEFMVKRKSTTLSASSTGATVSSTPTT